MGIEGIPEGYELVRVGTPKSGEWYVDPEGEPAKSVGGSFALGWVVIREISKPKQYRGPSNADIGNPCEVADGDKWKPAIYCGYTCGMSVGIYLVLFDGERQVDCTRKQVRIEVTE